MTVLLDAIEHADGDMMEFGVWEDYSFTDDLETFFKALPFRYGALAGEVLVGRVPELQRHGFDYQVEPTRALRAALLAAHRRFDHYLELAAEVGSSAWKPNECKRVPERASAASPVLRRVK
jgi:hypothetical protein